jgi:hypothetical protein
MIIKINLKKKGNGVGGRIIEEKNHLGIIHVYMEMSQQKPHITIIG